MRREIRPEQLAVDAAQVGHRDQPRIVERAEERAEEHHLREDEPAHAPAERHVLPTAVLAALGLADHVAEPAHHHVEQQQEPRADRHPAAAIAVEEEHGAQRHQEERRRAHDRPRHRRRHRVVGLPLGGGRALRHVVLPLTQLLPARPATSKKV